MKIVVVGLGYVGLSNAVLLSQQNEVIGVDISQDRVDLINNRKSPFFDKELSQYLAECDLDLTATTDIESCVVGADYVIVSTPTNYDPDLNSFDTKSVEIVTKKIFELEPATCVIVKSTVPIGFTNNLKELFNTEAIMFSPEFLREGCALYDNLYPSRIIIGEKSVRAENFAELLVQAAIKENVEVLFTGAQEAEAIKLFANSYLATRIAFFNELDNYALVNELDAKELITGVSLDPRIGNFYNNPSFGYGGYCLPKDTKQLVADYRNIPQKLISACVESNEERAWFLCEQVKKKQPKTLGFYRLIMKSGSENWRESSTIKLMKLFLKSEITIVIYEPYLENDFFEGFRVEKDLERFKECCDLIIANRLSEEMAEIQDKIFTRDLFGDD